MALVNWDDSYSVNIQAIDEQHRCLFGLLNRLHAAMKAGKGNAVMGPILNELVRYMGTHFAYEEKLMQQHCYPTLVGHRKQHQELRPGRRLRTEVRAGAVLLGLPLMEFLRTWLTHHIHESDRRYSGYLRACGVR